eukprot:6453235-Ditylum_brightwellii.AAC.3
MAGANSIGKCVGNIVTAIWNRNYYSIADLGPPIEPKVYFKHTLKYAAIGVGGKCKCKCIKGT